MSLFSYSLLLTDIVRSGLGMRHLGRSFLPMEPDSYIIFGPYAYPVIHLTTDNTTIDQQMRFWPYKYDSTSIAMRAIAQFMELPAWTPCVLSKQRCDESKGIKHTALFQMIDSLVGGVAAHRTDAQRSRGHLTLRAECTDRDRLHHYAFPWFFQTTLKRTNQAVYDSFNSSTFTTATTAVCTLIPVTRRPYSCNEQWTHFGRVVPDELAHISPTGSRSDFRVWDAITTHFRELASAYPDHIIDYTILDSIEDPSRGALSFQGRRYFDVVILARVRKCLKITNSTVATSDCTTVAVDDYRYEGANFMMDAPAWFPVIATLRAAGQTYTWLRVAILVGSCYVVRCHQSRNTSVFKRIRSTVRTFFLVPSQVVIYGSSLPISLYAVAHLIDSPAMYEIVDAHFNSWLGEMTLNWDDFLQLCAVSMRSVWILSALCHIAQAITTSCSWSQSRGVLGMTELSITLLASVTLLAKYRSVSFRNNEVLQVHEVTGSARRHEILRNLYQSTRSVPTSLLFGSTVDRQCLLCGLLFLIAVMLVWKAFNHLSPTCFPLRIALCSQTLIPYSAGTLWPCNRLVVSWYSTLVQRVPAVDDTSMRTLHRNGPTAPAVIPATFQAVATAALRIDRQLRIDIQDTGSGMNAQAFNANGAVAPATPARLQHMVTRALQIDHQVRTDMRVNGLVMRRTRASELIRRDLQSVTERSRHVQSMIMLVNLAVMTDPITFLMLRSFRGHQVGLYESRRAGSCHLLPLQLEQVDRDIPIEWREFTLLVTVNTKDLDWNDLLLCG